MKQVLDSSASKSALHNITMLIKKSNKRDNKGIMEKDHSQVLIYRDQRYQNNIQCHIKVPS